MRKYYIFIAALCIASLGLVTSSYLTSKGPTTDQNIVNDLDQIDNDISSYEDNGTNVPQTLAALNDQGQLTYNINTYAYTPMGSAYRICATFHTDNTSEGAQDESDPTYHQAGYQCFTHDEDGITPGGTPIPVTN
jgi:hypothetical protein